VRLAAGELHGGAVRQPDKAGRTAIDHEHTRLPQICDPNDTDVLVARTAKSMTSNDEPGRVPKVAPPTNAGRLQTERHACYEGPWVGPPPLGVGWADLAHARSGAQAW
jgi:hypothetical protein